MPAAFMAERIVSHRAGSWSWLGLSYDIALQSMSNRARLNPTPPRNCAVAEEYCASTLKLIPRALRIIDAGWVSM